MGDPSPTGFNGHDSKGRFVRGNRAARGNPLNRHAQKLRADLLNVVTENDVKKVARTLVKLAVAGDVGAARLLFDRLLGPVGSQLDLHTDGESVGRIVVALPGKKERPGE